tara:strand:- start:869 stop:2623 length:1755 start_codon:yes stop_codon:yes gene_type:complete
MKILKLLSRNIFIFLFSYFLIISLSFANETVDIWNLENNKKNNEIIKKKENLDKNNNQTSINNLNSTNLISVEQDEKFNQDENNLVGLYDPDENDLTIDMWERSDGDKITQIVEKIHKLNLSYDAKNIYNKLILTNSFPPKRNINTQDFINLKINWLIKNNDLELIKEFLVKNDYENYNLSLIKYYLNQNLSLAKIEKSCELFSFINNLPKDNYITKFQIYCLINENKKEIAQLQYDLFKESGYEDEFFDNIFNFLIGYSENIEVDISEKSLLEFHLTYLANENFSFEPNKKTKKIIWQYLSSNNLLTKANDVDLDDREKIRSFENATNNGSYKESDLLDLYTRFQFNIYQLVSVFDAYKLLPSYEARALLYQAFLVSKEPQNQMLLLELLKKEFDDDNLNNAFDKELIKLIGNINKDDLTNQALDFYNIQIARVKDENQKIKYNNKILHQSRLINYFDGKISKDKVEKDLNKRFKKLKKNKKYYFSTKDNIVIESLISDGIEIPEKYESILDLDKSNIPTDIEVMINDGETAMILLRLVEIIGEDDLKNLGTETLYFIISTLNKLNIDKIRNDIILQVIPVKA